MSSPIDASTSLYVPVHRRNPSYASSSRSGTPTSSPASTSRSLSPAPSPLIHTPGVYTPAELMALAESPLVAQLATSHGTVEALRAAVPEVVQTRKQRKAIAWHARQSNRTAPWTPTHEQGHMQTHKRTPSRGSQSHSESEEERAVSWRRA